MARHWQSPGGAGPAPSGSLPGTGLARLPGKEPTIHHPERKGPCCKDGMDSLLPCPWPRDSVAAQDTYGHRNGRVFDGRRSYTRRFRGTSSDVTRAGGRRSMYGTLRGPRVHRHPYPRRGRPRHRGVESCPASPCPGPHHGPGEPRWPEPSGSCRPAGRPPSGWIGSECGSDGGTRIPAPGVIGMEDRLANPSEWRK